MLHYWFKMKSTNILVDAGPDIKNQLIEHNIQKLDAVFITHPTF